MKLNGGIIRSGKSLPKRSGCAASLGRVLLREPRTRKPPSSNFLALRVLPVPHTRAQHSAPIFQRTQRRSKTRIFVWSVGLAFSGYVYHRFRSLGGYEGIVFLDDLKKSNKNFDEVLTGIVAAADPTMLKLLLRNDLTGQLSISPSRSHDQFQHFANLIVKAAEDYDAAGDPQRALRTYLLGLLTMRLSLNVGISDLTTIVLFGNKLSDRVEVWIKQRVIRPEASEIAKKLSRTAGGDAGRLLWMLQQRANSSSRKEAQGFRRWMGTRKQQSDIPLVNISELDPLPAEIPQEELRRVFVRVAQSWENDSDIDKALGWYMLAATINCIGLRHSERIPDGAVLLISKEKITNTHPHRALLESIHGSYSWMPIQIQGSVVVKKLSPNSNDPTSYLGLVRQLACDPQYARNYFVHMQSLASTKQPPKPIDVGGTEWEIFSN
uniref:Uncharacterized protein n=1 Tax=Mycena chlorophos TaxID=658473 RepID=A0ABQ0M1U9_MYCCL|nr:predicted protein [Mycena chlorophos]